MNKASKLVLALSLISSGLAYAGGSTAPVQVERPAQQPAPVVQPAPAVQAPVVQAPVVRAPVVVASPAFVRSNYVGIGAGRADADDGTFPDGEGAFKVFAGTNFHPNLGAEVGYVNIEEGGAGGDAPAGVEADRDLVYVAGIARTGLGPVNGFAKLGAWASAQDDNGGDTDSDPMFGLGLEGSLTSRLSGRLEWERFNNAAPINGDDIDLITASVMYRF